MKVRVAEPVLDGNEGKYVLNCLEENWISSRGKYIDQFERLLADYCGTKHAVVTNNGTTSLHLALVASGIQAGDEVIMPTLSYVATANSAVYCGARPVFVDCEPTYFSMDPDKIEAAITERTKAIMTVPLYGHPVDMDSIQEIANKYSLTIIEDSAESLGAEYKGRRVGSLAHCSSFSFFGNKTITTGEGGAITTDDEQLASRMRYLRGQAVDPARNYWHNEVGFNYRMTNIAAAIGVGQAERLDIHVGRRCQVAQWYREELWSDQTFLILPQEAPWAKHSYWMYTVMIRGADRRLRDEIASEMAIQGVETRPVFYPIHTMPSHLRLDQHHPVSEMCSASGLNLPTHGKLTRQDIALVGSALRSAYEIATRRHTLREAA